MLIVAYEIKYWWYVFLESLKIPIFPFSVLASMISVEAPRQSGHTNRFELFELSRKLVMVGCDLIYRPSVRFTVDDSIRA